MTKRSTTSARTPASVSAAPPSAATATSDNHFPEVDLSNFQSAVSKLAREPVSLSGRTRPKVDFHAATIAAATAAVNAVARERAGQGVPLLDPEAQQAKAAFDLATAQIAKMGAIAAAATSEQLNQAEAAFEQSRFGSMSLFWLRCAAEYVEHYVLALHSRPPYVEYASLTDFVLPMPERCTIAIVGDWGTGAARAQALLETIAAAKPDILIHLGDIYYSCTASEANTFYENIVTAFGAQTPRVVTLAGNHDMYAGGGAYYALLKRLGQPASFLALRNASWQILCADTGYNDFNPLREGKDATWIRDHDDGDDYSELAWHKDKILNAGGRRTMLMTHHQLFSRNAAIAHASTQDFAARHGIATQGKLAVNAYLLEELRDVLPRLALWLWGHEHNQVIYQPFEGLQRGRCVGASAIPVAVDVSLYTVSQDLAGQDVPNLNEEDPTITQLQPDSEGSLYKLGYAMIELDGAKGRARYLQFDPPTRTTMLMHEDDLAADLVSAPTVA